MLLSPWEADEGLHSGAPWKRASQHHTHHPHHRSPAPACVLDCTQPCLHHALAGAADTCPTGELAAQTCLLAARRLAARASMACLAHSPHSSRIRGRAPAPQPPLLHLLRCSLSPSTFLMPWPEPSPVISTLCAPRITSPTSRVQDLQVQVSRSPRAGIRDTVSAIRLAPSPRCARPPICAHVCPILAVDRRATPGPMTMTPGAFPES